MKLEVKVNDGGFLIDATMEVKDGVMIVTPTAPLSKEEEGKWTPKDGEDYYTPSLDTVKFVPFLYEWNRDETDLKLSNKGWVFKTCEECEEFCDKLNAGIAAITP